MTDDRPSKPAPAETGPQAPRKATPAAAAAGPTEAEQAPQKKLQKVKKDPAQREAERLARRAEIRAQRQAERKAERLAKRYASVPIVEVAGPPQRRRMEAGHWIALLSFVALVLVPTIVAAWYLWTRAADQYASHVGLTVQQDEAVNPAAALTGLMVQIGGQGPRSDTDILNEYLRSPALVATLAERFDLKGHYAALHAQDPVFALQPGASLDDLIDYWWRILYVRYDDATGLIDMRVQAFDADTAQNLAQSILEEATRVITELAAQARSDTVRFAEEDVQRAQAQLRQAREALIAFQTRSQILDPDTDVEGKLNIITSLQAELAGALISLDALRETTQASDPRITTAERRVEVIRLRIDAERSNMAVGGTGENYPALLAEYQRLAAERRHATDTLAQAFLALDAARSEAAKQSRYVITYVSPTLADAALYPRRFLWLAATTGAGFMIWFLLNVAYVSARDRR